MVRPVVRFAQTAFHLVLAAALTGGLRVLPPATVEAGAGGDDAAIQLAKKGERGKSDEALERAKESGKGKKKGIGKRDEKAPKDDDDEKDDDEKEKKKKKEKK